MRQLYVLGVSDDGTTLLLGSSDDAAKPAYGVALDDRLRAAVRGQMRLPGSERVESALPPREIQARLRAGDTPEEVAKAAGVPLGRVMPYAAPVIAERERIVAQARAAVMHRTRGPAGDKPLGELVDARLEETLGFREDSVDWHARRRPDGAWEVELDYRARGGQRSATWLWQPAERQVTPLDPAASRLGVEPVVAKSAAARSSGPTRKSRGERAKSGTARKRPPARNRTAQAPLAPPPAEPSATANPEMEPAIRTPEPATLRPEPATPTPEAATPEPEPATPEPEPATLEPEPTERAAPSVEPPAAAAREQAPGAARRPRGRVPVPSWSDVLLGVQATPHDTAAARRPNAPATRRGRKD